MAELNDSVCARPPYSYVGLITYAIQMSPAKKLTLWQIRDFLTANFPTVFPPESRKLKNVVRSQLTHNKCFHKVPHVGDLNSSRRCSNWCVDLALVDESAFRRRVYRRQFADTWPEELHVILNVPKIVLPTKLISTSDDVSAVNPIRNHYRDDKSTSVCSSEPANKRPRVDLAFGIDRILSESFGCTQSASISPVTINRPSCALGNFFASPSCPTEHSVEHPRLEEYPACSHHYDVPLLTPSFESVCSFPSLSDIHSFDSEFLLEDTTTETSTASESLFVMNSTRINPDISVDSLDFPFSPIDRELDDDTVEGSSCFFDVISDVHDADVITTEPPAGDIDVIIPSLHPDELSPFEDLLAYLTVDGGVSCNFSDLLDADFRFGV